MPDTRELQSLVMQDIKSLLFCAEPPSLQLCWKFWSKVLYRGILTSLVEGLPKKIAQRIKLLVRSYSSFCLLCFFSSLYPGHRIKESSDDAPWKAFSDHFSSFSFLLLFSLVVNLFLTEFSGCLTWYSS